MADFFKLSFSDSTGLVNWGAPFGTELTFIDRETVGLVDMPEPYINEMFKTAEGYSGGVPTRVGRSWVVGIQLLTAQTIAKLEHIQTAIQFGYYASAVFLNGYLLPNQTLNTLIDQSGSANLSRCIVDVGDEQVIHRIKQARGPLWKNAVPLVIRESIALPLPQSGDVIVVGGPGGIGQ